MWEDKMWQRLRRMQRKMDRLFGNFGTIGFGRRFEEGDGKIGSYRKAWADFNENDKEFVINVELPGIEKENIELEVTDSGIEIRAEKKREEKREDREKGEYSFAKIYSGFARAIDLPEDADLSKVDAEYKNGVLTVKVGKKKIKVEKGKSVEIK